MWDANTALPLRQLTLGAWACERLDIRGKAPPYPFLPPRPARHQSVRGFGIVSSELPGREVPSILVSVCTLAIYFQMSPDFPVVVAANRDEFYDRPAAPPAPFDETRGLFAGRDLVAGGTWLGVNPHHMVAGIVNRRTDTMPDPTRRSRGQLCVDVLQQRSVAEASELVRRAPGTLHNPFNILIASPEAAEVIGNAHRAMQSTTLVPGLHLLTNLDLNDFECPRIAKSYTLFDAVRPLLRLDALNELLPALRAILSDHSTPLDPRSAGPPNNLCVHTERFGTRSSSIIVYVAAQRRFRFWHANGAPCEVDYTEVAVPPGST